MRPLIATVLIAAGLAACSGDTGPSAPESGAIQTVCLAEVCVNYPADWDIELAEDFIVLTHPAGATASVGRLDMRGVVESAGEVWPADPEATMRAFWELLDELGDADLRELTVVADGVIDTRGKLDGSVLWHRLVVTDAPSAWGAEMRAPNGTWETHAEMIVGSLILVPNA